MAIVTLLDDDDDDDDDDDHDNDDDDNNDDDENDNNDDNYNVNLSDNAKKDGDDREDEDSIDGLGDDSKCEIIFLRVLSLVATVLFNGFCCKRNESFPIKVGASGLGEHFLIFICHNKILELRNFFYLFCYCVIFHRLN